MKLTCDRSALVDKLAILSRGVSTRLVLPVLSGILLQASEGRIELYSTDMEISIKASLAAELEQEGEIVVPARLFSDIVRNLPGESVTVEASETTATISGGHARFTLNAWSASDFPQTSTFDMEGSFSVGREPFVETLNKVGRAASRDETRPILTGVLMTIAGDELRMVATDSYRLAVKKTKLESALPAEVRGDRAGQGTRRGGPPGRLDGRRRPRGRHRREPGALQGRRRCQPGVHRLAAGGRPVPELPPAHPRLVRSRGRHSPRTTSSRPRGASACWRRRTRRSASPSGHTASP